MSDTVTLLSPGEATGGVTDARTGDGAARVAELLAEPSVGARRVEVHASTALYEPGAPPRGLYFIHTGQVRVFQVRPNAAARLLEILGPDDWFGLPALAHNVGDATRAVAVSKAVVSEIPADRLLAVLPRYPRIAAELIGQLASKLQAAYADATTLVFDDTEKRVIRTLLQFSRSAAASPQDPQAGGDGGVVLRMTHQQLAQHVGAARETVSLALTQLRQRNLLRTGRNHLWFNPEALESYHRRRGEPAPEPEGAGAGQGG